MRNKNKFKNDLKKAFKEAELKAIKSNFDDIVSEEDSVSEIADKLAKNTAKIYSDYLGPEIAKIIDGYLDSLEFDVTKLSAAGSPVSGILKIMP